VDFLKDWLADKVVKNFHGMQSFLVSSIWRAQNSSIFREITIPPEVTTGIIMKLSKEFISDLKIKDPRLPSMLEVDFGISWGFFDWDF
jgi:hypothetical protein